MTAVGASAANDNDVLENAKLVRDVICFFFSSKYVTIFDHIRSRQNIFSPVRTNQDFYFFQKHFFIPILTI